MRSRIHIEPTLYMYIAIASEINYIKERAAAAERDKYRKVTRWLLMISQFLWIKNMIAHDHAYMYIFKSL